MWLNDMVSFDFQDDSSGKKMEDEVNLVLSEKGRNLSAKSGTFQLPAGLGPLAEDGGGKCHWVSNIWAGWEIVVSVRVMYLTTLIKLWPMRDH